MTAYRGNTGSSAQRGAVLILVLVFAAMLNLLAASVIQSAGLQARISGNIALQSESKLLAESILQELVQRTAVVSLADPVGHRNCSGGSSAPDCDGYTLGALRRVDVPTGMLTHYYAQRRDPLVQTVRLLEESPGAGSAGTQVDIALFELGAIVRTAGAASGRTHVVVGMAVPLNGASPWPLYWREPAIDPP